jgi:uncharacterized membrane protein
MAGHQTGNEDEQPGDAPTTTPSQQVIVNVPGEPTSPAAGAAAAAAVAATRSVIAPLVVPPLIGIVLIACVVFDLGDSPLTESGGTASTALVVGAVLILGSAALYVRDPVRYDRFFTDVRQRVGGDSE